VGESLGSVAEEIACMKLIVPVLNRFDLLQRMINSIDVEATVYVINNSSVEQSVTCPDNVTVHWVNLPSNLGVASSWNLGIKMLPFESRWFITSADCVFASGDLDLLQTAKPDALTLCDKFPYYQTFAVGEEIVKTVGLFDEGLHPIYFEDNDFEQRMNHKDMRVDRLPLQLGHDNSSTINSDAKLSERNQVTFANNEKYFQNKIHTYDYSEGRWQLQIRRDNSWD
jgi:GT2 family glycosyltransferase